MYKYINPNPKGKSVGDCTVRAIATVTSSPWDQVYCELCKTGFDMGDMPDANAVWGTVLRQHGFKRHPIPETCPDCYTVRDFCADHPTGVYVLALPSHVVAVTNGNHLDTWDSGDERPIYYWTKEE